MRRPPGATVKITGVEIRRLRIDASPWYFGHPIPADEPDTWGYPLVRVRTDEGVNGFATGYGANGEGRPNAYAIRDAYASALTGLDPLHHERIWPLLQAAEPAPVRPHRHRAGDPGRGLVGHQGQDRELAASRPARNRADEDARLPGRFVLPGDTGTRVRGGTEAPAGRLPRLQAQLLRRARAGHPAGCGPRGRQRATASS